MSGIGRDWLMWLIGQMLCHVLNKNPMKVNWRKQKPVETYIVLLLVYLVGVLDFTWFNSNFISGKRTIIRAGLSRFSIGCFHSCCIELVFSNNSSCSKYCHGIANARRSTIFNTCSTSNSRRVRIESTLLKLNFDFFQSIEIVRRSKIYIDRWLSILHRLE